MMLIKFTIGACLAATLCACSSFAPVTGSHYVSADGQLQIRGELIDSTDVRIFVNDAKVIDDRVSLLHGDGEFAGHFQGRPVSARCATPSGLKLNATTCTVALDGERVTLTL
jgi:hypothetical protein